MASEAFAGVGTKFQRWDGAAWQDIAEVNSIDGPGMTKDVLEVTSLDTDAGYNEFITGFAEGGTLTLDMNFTRETYELMKEDFESDEVRSYRIQLPDYDSEPSTFTIEGLVIELPITMTSDDKVTADVVIQITSQVVLDVGSTVPAEESETPPSGYDADLETYWGGLGTPLSTAQKDRIQTMITTIKTACGITNLSQFFDLMYLFANETQEAALRNMVTREFDCFDPSSADYGLPQFEQYRGVYSTWNLGQHLDTGYNQLRDAVNAGVTDCAIGVYCTDEKATAGQTCAWGSGPYNQMILRYTTTEMARGNVNGIAVTNFLENDSDVGQAEGFLITGRSGNNIYAQKNAGPLIGPTASTAGAGYGASMLILSSRDAAGNSFAMTNNEVGFFFMSKMVNAAQALAIVDAVETYLDAVGTGEISSAF